MVDIHKNHTAFFQELQALLGKYDVEITAENKDRGWDCEPIIDFCLYEPFQDYELKCISSDYIGD